jgi:hypothetical protein
VAGIHSDHTVHRLVSGEAPRVGLRVMNNDLKWGTIVKVATDQGCGFYCNAWHEVLVDDDRKSIFNCDRLSTKDLISNTKDPHPERGYNEELPKRIFFQDSDVSVFGAGSTAQIVDEDKGGVIAYTHHDNAQRLVVALLSLAD